MAILTIDLILALLIGLFFGTFMVLLLDMQFLGGRIRRLATDRQRLKQAVTQKEELLERQEKVLFSTQQELHAIRQELRSQMSGGADHELLAELRTEVAALRARLDLLQVENRKLRQELQEALERNRELRANTEQISAKWIVAETKNEDAQKILAQREKNLQQVLTILTTTKQIAQKWINNYRELEEEKQQLDARLQTMQERVDQLQSQIETTHADLPADPALQEQLAEATAELTAAKDHKRALETQTEALQGEMAETIEHKLEEIRGIGPTYAGRLRENGIRTLGDLIRTDPAELAEVVKLRGAKSQPQEWIEEAKTLHTAEESAESAAAEPATPSIDESARDDRPWQPASG